MTAAHVLAPVVAGLHWMVPAWVPPALAQAITEHTLRQTIQQTGLRVAMAGGLGLEDFL